jgi:hypothetical protein
MEVNKQVPIVFQKLKTFEAEDTRFLQVKIWLMHLEENLNGSFFSKESVEEAIPTLANTPILAYIEKNKDDENDFSDHRQVLVKEDGKYKIKYIGQAIGVIPETNNAQFEKRVCDDGIEREFLTCEGLVWDNKWDDAPDVLNRDLIKAQSMELHDEYEGNFNEEDNLFHFTKFKFYGACALGKDVLPAMRSATIEVQNFSFDNFAKEVQEKMEQFKQFSLNNQSSSEVDIKVSESNNQEFNQEGGNSVDEKLEFLKKYNLTQEQLDFSIDELSLEELDEKLKTFSVKAEEKTEDPKETEAKFSLTSEQFREELVNQLRTEKYTDDWGWEYSRYSYVDAKDNIVFAYDRNDNWKLYGFEFTVNGDSIAINFESKKRKKFEIVDFEEGVSTEFQVFPQEAIDYAVKVKEQESLNQFTQEKETLVKEHETAFSTITVENERLKKFEQNTLQAERKSKEDAIFERFTSEYKLTEEDMKEIKELANSMELSQIEEKLFALVGKKFAKFSAKDNSKQSAKIPADIDSESKEDESPYGDLFSRYASK